MDQIKIGKFIAENRKNKNLTQEQLAEKLGITRKSVSRWENGNTMPDLSLFKPLCDILDITINELMRGEKIDISSFKEKSEENILNVISSSKEKTISIKRKYKLIISMILLVLIISFLIFYFTKNRYEQSEIESITVFGENIDVVKNKKVYRIAMKSATIKDYLDKKGCIKPIEIKYKNGLKTKEWAFENNEGNTFVYIYSTIDKTFSNEIMKNINDESLIYYIGAYDVFVGVYLDEPLKIDDSCKSFH